MTETVSDRDYKSQMETDIGKRIQYYREKTGLNKAALAKEIGVSDVSVGYWESGQIKQIGHDRLAKLSIALNVSIEELLGLSGVRDNYLEDETKKQRLHDALIKIAEHYSTGEPLFLDTRDVALLVENTHLGALLSHVGNSDQNTLDNVILALHLYGSPKCAPTCLATSITTAS
ncbi:MAG: helix-turn-helix domain-containing protein [Halomonas sp.]|uniref:helix-turn-helix domain-containing protein n=1 Tax=Halomonas sp. TaxID=1486246 RepID=UPI003F91DA0F